MSRLTQDGTAESVCETKFSGANGDREMFIFLVQLTTSRNWQLCPVYLYSVICDDDTYIKCCIHVNALLYFKIIDSRRD